jgi:hypothetical protein
MHYRRRISRMRAWCVVVLLAFSELACGEESSDNPGGLDAAATDAKPGDTGSKDGTASESGRSSEAGGLTCGSARCEGEEVCIHPACCAFLLPETDAGSCPDGSAFADVLAGCVINTCTPAPPFCWSPDPDAGQGYGCTGQDGSIATDFLDSPVPSGSSHVCYEACPP